MTDPAVDYTDLAVRYIEAWNERDDASRRVVVERVWTPGATYVDPLAEASGHAAIAALIAGVQEQFPNFEFRLASLAESHHDHFRFSWELGPADRDAVVRGSDVATVEDGRIGSVVGFLDQVPAELSA